MEGAMLHSKASKFGLLAAVCMLGAETVSAASGQTITTEWSGGKTIYLAGLPGNQAVLAMQSTTSIKLWGSVTSAFTLMDMRPSGVAGPWCTEARAGKVS
jgi:hypothetical protein